MKDSHDVTDREMARILTDMTQLGWLTGFFKEVTLSEAAKDLGIKMTRLFYHVQRWKKLGILEVSREETRKGKAIKVYRLSAKVFFVPFDLTPSDSLKDLLIRITYLGDEVFSREIARVMQEMSPGWVLKISAVEDKVYRPHIELKQVDDKDQADDEVPRQDSPAVLSNFGLLELDFPTAKAFRDDMAGLIRRYEKKQMQSGQRYGYRVGLTPILDNIKGKE